MAPLMELVALTAVVPALVPTVKSLEKLASVILMWSNAPVVVTATVTELV